jgi:hypothetical protein
MQLKTDYLWVYAAIFVGSFSVGASRFLVPTHGLSFAGSYEAFAHIWVGILIALLFVKPFRLSAGVALAIITTLEIVMFLKG